MELIEKITKFKLDGYINYPGDGDNHFPYVITLELYSDGNILFDCEWIINNVSVSINDLNNHNISVSSNHRDHFRKFYSNNTEWKNELLSYWKNYNKSNSERYNELIEELDKMIHNRRKEQMENEITNPILGKDN